LFAGGDSVQSRLSEALRAGTREQHARLERCGFMQALVRGRIERPAYCALLRNLHAIYAALEGALERHARHPWIAPARLAGLARGAALAQDLTALQGPDWQSELALLPGARHYVHHMTELERPRRPTLD